MLVVMRHGESDHNVEQYFNSDDCHPDYKMSHLTVHGKQQIMCTAAWLKEQNIPEPHTIYTSNLPRTIETATILKRSMGWYKSKLIPDARLGESKAGKLESKTYQTMSEYGVYDAWDLDLGSKMWDGESYSSVADRINDFLMTEWDPDSYSFVVSHGSPLLVMHALLTETHTKHRVATAGVTVMNGKEVVSTFRPVC